MSGNLTTKNNKLRCSYHENHDHRIENSKTLKQFLEGLVNKGHLAKYVKVDEKMNKRDDEGSIDDEPHKRLAKRVVNGVLRQFMTLLV